MKLKKGDKVIVITGKDKGKSGTIERAFPATNKVLMSGINVHKAHQKPRRAGEKGQTVERHMPVHASNVMLVEGSKRVRPAFKMVDKKKVRVSRKSGNVI